MAVNVVQSAISSRGFNKWFPWISGAVAVAGLVVFLVVYFSNTTPQAKGPTGPPVKAAAPPKNIPFPDAAWSVATKFILTAVARKNLQEAYALTDPSLRSGITTKEWRKGNLPVVYSTVGQILKTNWKNTNYAHPRDAQINVIIIPKNGKAWNAQVGLAKVGHGARAHWLVNYFQPLAGPRIPHP
jgi:hypothetical protein